MGIAEDRQRIKPGVSPFRWGSHRPVLQTVIDLCRPRLALELGMGQTSTRFLSDRLPTLVSVENNRTWFGQMVAAVPPRPGFQPRCLPLYTDPSHTAEVRFSEPPHAVSPYVLEQALAHYRSLIAEFGRFDLVLVDQYASTRYASLVELLPHADALVLHDTEDGARPADDPHHDIYHYNTFFARADLAAFYHVRCDDLDPWTDVLIRRSLGVDPGAFNSCLARHVAAYRAAATDQPSPLPRRSAPKTMEFS